MASERPACRKIGRMAASLLMASMLFGCASLRGTGDLGLVVERTTGTVLVVETTHRTQLASVTGLGDLSHASAVYSRDGRYAYVFGRDGGLTKVDLLRARVNKRVVQAGNSIGGAISQDGTLVAVANYEPGGIKVFDAQTLALVADIPAISAGTRSRVVGLVDAPGLRFVYSLYDAGEIWVVDMTDRGQPNIRKFPQIGQQPYDALLTPEGRYYIAGLFGEDGFALLDLWYPERGVRRILSDYRRTAEPLPVYKMPHLEGWAIAGQYAFVPAVGEHEVLVVDMGTWQIARRIPVAGQPVFAMACPDGRTVWVTLALPQNDTVQVIAVPKLDITQTLRPGRGVLHLEFTPRGEAVWMSLRDEDRVDIYDTASFQRLASLPAAKPSGIFFAARAQRLGL